MGTGVSKNTRVTAFVGGPGPEKRPSASSIVCTREIETERASSTPEDRPLTIVHFNDVYNIEEREKEPVGGAARFKTKVDSLKEFKPLVLFSGDALNPSNMSTVTQGQQMVPVLNSLGVHAAVYGNHDFDFGVEHLVSIAHQTQFPWLLSNVRDKATGQLLAEGRESLVMEWEGKKIGLIGLVEWEWLVTLATIEPEEVDYTDFVSAAKELVPQLKQQGCELLVALTHMRIPNDVRLAEQVPELHLILGGHDHHYEKKEVGKTLILKSGSDFRDFSQITVTFNPDCCPSFLVERHTITRDVPADPNLQAVVNEFTEVAEAGMQEEIGRVECDLEGRFCYIRTQETNLGNLVTDIMRRATRADVALLNAGTLRSDSIHESGVFRVKDLLAILPMVDALTVLQVTGEQLVQALENGVSQYPKHEGRFPQVSGLSFSFDPSQPSGRRVVLASVRVNGEPLQSAGVYKLCTKSYIASGKDGYDVFRETKVVLGLEEGPILSSIVRNHFHTCFQHWSRDETDWGDTKASGSLQTGDGRINPQVEGRIVNISVG